MNESSQSREEMQPPKAPDIDRRLHLHRWQWIGMPLLLGIPVLALLGVFGETRAVAQASTAQLSVRVEYPTKYRYKMLNSIRIDVTNRSAARLDTVTVALDTAYAGRFSTVVAIPSFEDPYSIPLTDLEPGAVRRVRIELQGEHYGRHTGDLRITAGGPDTARVEVSTFIFP